MTETTLETWHRLVRTQDPSGLNALLAEDAVLLACRPHPATRQEACRLVLGRSLQCLLQPDVPLRARGHGAFGRSPGIRDRDRWGTGQWGRPHQVERHWANHRIQGHAQATESDQRDSSTNGRNAPVQSVSTRDDALPEAGGAESVASPA